MVNPFPGLRPYEPDEDHLFFGREKETDDLVRRLRSHRFLSVVGTSGSGKSSLVRSGLIPSLESGFMVTAGSRWRVSIFRPGEDPIGRLAEALDRPDVIGVAEEALAGTNRVLLEATLRRGALGLANAVRFARIPANDNVLILVDQFEELFRFRRGRQPESSREEAVAFVKLLLEAAKQTDVPIYVVLTMRSDFIGDCMDYPGLPEAVNESQYLVPRMTRDELRSAITGPVAVAGGRIAPRLVVRLLNEAGDDQDQLPLVQHVLMRAWDHWAAHRNGDEPIDISDYEAIGTLRHALSQHAEEAYEETGSDDRKRLTAGIFKALTDTFSDPRGVRRPTSVADLAAICEAPEANVAEIVEIFRRPGRSFLMPPVPVELASPVIVDVSHESLMRCWERLIGWAQEERASAAQYVRLSREASWFDQGAAGLWGDPELELALRWRRESRPTAAWARRYDEAFDRATQFLDLSEEERDRQRAERRRRRIRYLELAWGSAAVLLVMTLVFVYLFASARYERKRAEYERKRAEDSLGIANSAVTETLAATDRPPELVAAESPDAQRLRRDLLQRAQRLFQQLRETDPTNPAFLAERADANFRLGDIYRMLGDTQHAAQEYKEAIRQFDDLARAAPGTPAYRESLASTYNWLGETLRPLPEGRAEARNAFDNALRLQDALVRADPGNLGYQQALARTHYNRGILYGSIAALGDADFERSDADFRAAIALLEPLVRAHPTPQLSQDLARASNNLATLLQQDASRLPEARQLYERAIQTHEGLVAQDPENRLYKLELTQFSDNLSDLLRSEKDFDSAARHNSRAIELINELARPRSALGIELADAHNLQGRILQARGSPGAVDEYRTSLDVYKSVAKALDDGSRSAFHMRFGDLLLNLAAMLQAHREDNGARQVLSDAVSFYAAAGQQAASLGRRAEAQRVLDNLVPLLPGLTGPDAPVAAPIQKLQETVGGSKGR